MTVSAVSEEELIELFKEAPKESFELLLRNMRIRGVLEKLYAKHSSGMTLSYDENFDTIFEEFFRFFFRPLEIAVQGARQMSFIFLFFEPELISNQYELIQAYVEFLRAWYSHMKLTAEIMLGRTVPRAVKDVVGEFARRYRERIERYRIRPMVEISEYPLLYPKSVFVNFDKSVKSWEEFSRAFEEYRDMIKGTYVSAAEKFIELANSKKFEDYQSFASSFFEKEAKAFDELLKRDDYLDVQRRMLGSLMDYITYFRSFLEEILTSNPVNPFATVSLLDEAFKRITDLRRKVRELERRVAELERGGGSAGGEDKGS